MRPSGPAKSARHLLLLGSVLTYSFAVRKLRYSAPSGVLQIDEGARWYVVAFVCACLGTATGVLIAREDIVRPPGAPRWRRILGGVAMALGGVLLVLELLSLLPSALHLPTFLPGAPRPR